MKYTELVMEYNRMMKEALCLIYGELNRGQQNKVLKEERVRALLEKYKVIGKEDE